MDQKYNPALRVISTIVMSVFLWTFGGVFEVAYAVKESGQPSAVSNQQDRNSNNQKQRNITPPGLPLPQVEGKKAEEKFQKAVEDVEKILADTVTDTETIKQRLKAKKAEIDSHDIKIRKQFKETEAKITDLPEEIKKRHRDFVKHYDDNLRELILNLDEIQKHGAESKEFKDAIYRTKAHLEKTKPPKRHKPLDPNKLPHETVEPVQPSRIEAKATPKTQERIAKTLNDIYNATIDFLFPSAYAADISPVEKAANLAETVETPLTPEIVDFANELGDIPIDIFVPVRDGFKYEPYAGSVKGAVQTLREKSGNEWDLASLLIALLRAKGIPARYAVGTIQMPIDQAMEWLGVEDPTMAATLLVSNGRPTSLITSGGKISAIEVRHVWVQAFIPFTASRGTTTGQGDKWVDMDPSYKPQKITQIQNLTGMPLFDQAGYLTTFRSISPYEFYEGQLQGFLDTSAPGFKPNALMRETEIVSEVSEVLIGQLPYMVNSISGTYSEIPNSFRQKFTLTLSDPDSGAVQLTFAAVLPQIIGKRLTLSYIPATSSDQAVINNYGGIYSTPAYLIYLKPVIKLDGAIVTEGSPVQPGMQQSLVFLFNSTMDVGRVANTVIAGEYYAIGLNAQNTEDREAIIERANRLIQVKESINFSDLTTLDDKFGELLYLTAMVYHQNLSAGIRKLSSLYKVTDIRKVSEIMCMLRIKVDSIYGIPLSIQPMGITVDMDRDIHLVIPVDGDISRIEPYMTAMGMHSSYLEHDIIEKIYKSPAISAVRAIQFAHDQGINVYTVTKGNISSVLPYLQTSEDVITDITNVVNAGKEVIVPARDIIYEDWKGIGYIIRNPQNGAGAYMISGGFGGGSAVRATMILDMITAQEAYAATGAAAKAGTQIKKICYPGKDSKYDVCYSVVNYDDIIEKEKDSCKAKEAKDTDCKTRYEVSHSDLAMPLIYIDEDGKDKNTYLSRTVTAGEFQSTDGARYMRVGNAIIIAIDYIADILLISYKIDKVAITSAGGSGYRSNSRNEELRKAHPTASKTTYHKDGVAAYVAFKDSKAEFIEKCFVLQAAFLMLGDFGEILDEGPGVMNNTTHIAIAGGISKRNDKSQYPSRWECKK